MTREQPPWSEQDIYNLGYDTPAKSYKNFAWRHIVELNAYHCGQMDQQNQQPRNHAYRSEDYNPVTGDRNAGSDIVERLRKEYQLPMRPVSKGQLLIEAADEIERLRHGVSLTNGDRGGQ